MVDEKIREQIERTDRQLERTDRQLEHTDRQLERTGRQLERIDRQIEMTQQERWVVAQFVNTMAGIFAAVDNRAITNTEAIARLDELVHGYNEAHKRCP